MTIVRKFVGPVWYPKKMAFRSLASIGQFTSIQFQKTYFLFDQTTCRVELPLPYHPNNMRRISLAVGGGSFKNVPEAAFVQELKHALTQNLSEGYPDIVFATEITRTNVRTLQRNLSRAGITYAKIVEYTQLGACP